MILSARPSDAIERLGTLLCEQTGQLLSEARRWRIETSLRPLLRERGLPSLDALVVAIDRDRCGTLLSETIDAMLNHESSFFRDIAVFDAIERQLLPALRERATEKVLRIWSVGCSIGQEAYSIAMIIKRMGAMWDGWRITIHATDVSPIAIEKARRGRYAQIDIQRGLPVSELLRWFKPVDQDWQIAPELRDMVSFGIDNVVTPGRHIGLFDLILCRNVLFYFPDETKRIAQAQISRQIRPGGRLILGAGEMLPGGSTVFSSCRELSCVYVADKTE